MSFLTLTMRKSVHPFLPIKPVIKKKLLLIRFTSIIKYKFSVLNIFGVLHLIKYSNGLIHGLAKKETTGCPTKHDSW